MAECFTPFIVMDKERQIPVPCGKCPNCVARRISAWSFRLMQEAKHSESAYFITLTYAPEHCPISRNGFMELRKPHVQQFFKTLRTHQWRNGNCEKIKYYIAGEYGDTFKRPHYHAVIFNLDLEIMIGKKHYNQVKRGFIPLDGKYNFHVSQWDKGHITIGQVCEASVGYTLIYMNKPWRPMHANDDRQPQFSLMSKRLGEKYLSPAMIKWYKDDLDNRLYCNIEDGKKIAMPRYYKQKLFQAIYQDPELAEYHQHRVGQVQLEKLNERKKTGITDKEWYQADARQLAAFKKQQQKIISKNH